MCINDLPEGFVSYLNMFVDDDTITKEIKSIGESYNFQGDLDMLQQWLDT